MKNLYFPFSIIIRKKIVILFVISLFLGVQAFAQCQSGLLTNTNGYYGGFEAGGVNGNNNFGPGIASTDYSYGSHQRQYQILMNTNGQSGYRPLMPHSGNYFFTTHTSPSRPHWKIWYKTLSVQPGETYEICSWIANLKVKPVGGFDVAINVIAGNTITVIATQKAVTNSWVQMCGTYTVPAGITSIVVEIDDPDPSSVGGSHFLAIDDICINRNGGSIGDRVWQDANANGLQDGLETTGIPNVTVNLLDAFSNLIATTTTNASGNYIFTGLAAGTYIIEFPTSQSGLGLSPSYVGTDRDIDSDPSVSTGLTPIIILGSGQNITNIDAGYIQVPDLSPSITASPNIMNGTTSFSVIVEIFEVLNVPTNGSEILVRITKDPRMTFTFNTAATMIGSSTVNNSVWTYDGSNPIFHIFKTNVVISAFGVSTFGFQATFTPGQSQGKFTLTASLNSGSGGEVRTDNNQDAEILDYFIN